VTLVWLVLGWLAGVAAGVRFGRADLLPIWVIGGVLALCGAALFRKSQSMRLAFVVVACALLGAARLTGAIHTSTPQTIDYFNDSGAATFSGIVEDDPDVRDNVTYLRVAAERILQEKEWVAVGGVVLVRVNDAARIYKYGDRVQVRGALQTPGEFDTFSYRAWLARGGVYAVLYYPQVKLLASAQGSPLLAASFALRDALHDQIQRLIPAPASALLSGILLGLDNDLTPEIRQGFQDTGTSHIVAISGSNITIIGGIFVALTGWIRRKGIRAALTVAGLFAYAFFVGASPSVVRAALMGALTIAALLVGRQSWSLTALAFTVFIQTLVNPYVIEDAGLILSGFASLGIILYLTPLSRWSAERLEGLRFGKPSGFILDAVWTTVAAQVTTLPISILLFGRLSWVTFFANALIVPAQPAIMSVGLLAVVASFVFFPLGQIVGYVVYLPLAYTLWVVRTIGALPGIASPVELPGSLLVMYYGVLFGLTYVATQPGTLAEKFAWVGNIRRFARTSTLLFSSGAIAALIWLAVFARPDGQLRLWFLETGDGYAALLRSPDGAFILIDGGPNRSRLLGALGDHLPFNQRRLELILLTGAADQVAGALPAVIARYEVGAILSAKQTGDALPDRTFGVLRDGTRLTTSDGLTIEAIAMGEGFACRIEYKMARLLLVPNATPDQLAKLRSDPRAAGMTLLQIPETTQCASGAARGCRATSSDHHA